MRAIAERAAPFVFFWFPLNASIFFLKNIYKKKCYFFKEIKIRDLNFLHCHFQTHKNFRSCQNNVRNSIKYHKHITQESWKDCRDFSENVHPCPTTVKWKGERQRNRKMKVGEMLERVSMRVCAF